MSRNLFFIPLGGLDPTQYYTKSQVDTLIQDFITSSVNDLVNYYTKTETYTQAEVNTLIGSIESIHFEFAASTSDVQDPQSNLIYLIGPSGTGADQYEEYVYANNQWTKIGDTSIDLSGYATTADLQNAINTAMDTLVQYAVENFYNKSEVDEMLQGKQDTLTAGEGISIQGNTISTTGGGGNAWYGSQAEFDALENPSADVDYFISDQIKWDEIKEKPDMDNYTTKTYVDDADTVLDTKIASKISGQFITQEQFQSITPKEGENYFIEGNTVELQFTFTDSTQATYNVVVD